MGKKKDPPPAKSKMELRADIISYIRNERDTVLKKWMALSEALHHEDRDRENFHRQLEIDNHRLLPLTIQKLIGSLKKAVRTQMRNKGGTPHSIVRAMFVYWDADKSGQISADELDGAMKSLGIIMTPEDRKFIVDYYGGGGPEMSYNLLLRDIQKGEPTVIEFVDKKTEDDKAKYELRFEEVADKFKVMPKLVKYFVTATREYIAHKLRVEGGTPEHHLKQLFVSYDYDYSSGLCLEELIKAASKGMNLQINDEQARMIIDHFDKDFSGELKYEHFINDVNAETKPVMFHVERSKEEVMKVKAELSKNPFFRRPFEAPANKVLTKFKNDLLEKCEVKVKALGGTPKSWIREAFLTWETTGTRKITDPEVLIGASKRLGVTISVEDAKTIMKCYDRFNTGEMHYDIFIDEVNKLSPHFLSDINVEPVNHLPDHSGNMKHIISKIKNACDKYSKRSNGVIQPGNVLHGTCLKFDKDSSGKLLLPEVKSILESLKVKGLKDAEIQQLVTFFDTNGSRTFDYNACVRQLFGDDAVTKALVLPQLSSLGANTVTMASPGKMTVTLGPTQKYIEACSDLSPIQKKNLKPIMSPSQIAAAKNLVKKQMHDERSLIEAKLKDIEYQQAFIIADYEKRHPKPQPEQLSIAQLREKYNKKK